MVSFPVVQVFEIKELTDGRLGFHGKLRCGCEVKRRVAQDRAFEIIPGKFMVVGKYKCPADCSGEKERDEG
ncbi:MAG: hypothetical protein VYA34_10155 [Myxococcota bacterium]|nr:hypothetical protein [Myxococcota bacterium]